MVFYALNQYRTIVVTDQRILVCDSGKFSTAKADSIVAELPRSTRLGPTTGTLWHKVPVASEQLRIHKRFFKDVDQADAAAR